MAIPSKKCFPHKTKLDTTPLTDLEQKSTCLNHNKTLLCIVAYLTQLQWRGPSQSEIGSVGQSIALITRRL